jgi:hypothetical protein
MPVFDDVHLCFPRAGGYAITFPVQAGDEVLIVFASRCIDEWWYIGGENNIAPEFRMHDLSDSFAILAPASRPKALNNVSTNSLQIRNEDLTKYIEISENSITVQSDSDVIVSAETVAITSTNVNITASADVNITTPANISLTAGGSPGQSISLTAHDIYLNGVVH